MAANVRTEVLLTPAGACVRLTVSSGEMAMALVLSAGDTTALGGLLTEQGEVAAARNESLKNGAVSQDFLEQEGAQQLDGTEDVPSTPEQGH
jgi:hypothetical protein